MNQNSMNYLPNFCSIKLLFVIIISGVLLALILTFSGALENTDMLQMFGLKSLFIQWILLPTCFMLCISKNWLKNLTHLMASFIVLGWISLFTSVASYIALDLNLVRQGLEARFLVINLIIANIIGTLLLRYLFIEYEQRQQSVAQARAQFQALQSRIRPHFLFNSMNTVASLTRKDPILAESLIEDLADLFRASLAEVNQFSTLGEELELAKGYLRIEQQRLGKRLAITWDIKHLPKSTPTPHLLLQPLLENAVYHGIEPLAKGGRIMVSGRLTGQVVNLSIRNPKRETKKIKKGNQMALDNIRQRLQNAYAEKGRLICSEVDGEYQVRLSFPIYPENT